MKTPDRFQLLTFFTENYLLILLIAGMVFANLYWVNLETRPPHWDMGRHLLYSLKYRDDLYSGNIPYLIGAYRYYPPFLYWTTLPFYVLFGSSIITAVASIQVYLVIFVVATYKTGKYLWNKQAGLLAALFAATTPMMVSQFKEYQLDAPTAAWTALTLYLLIRSEHLRDKRYTYWLAVVFAGGLLLKWTFPLIFLLPIAYAVIKGVGLARKNAELPQFLKQLGIALAIILVLAGPWYIANAHALRNDLGLNAFVNGTKEGDPAIGTLSSNGWYFWNLLNNQLYLVPFLAFWAGLLVTCRKKVFLQKNLYLLLLIASTWIAFTFIQNKDARYTLPFISSIALVATFWIAQLPQIWQRLLTAISIAYCLIAFYTISFGTELLPRVIDLSTNLGHIQIFAQHGYIIGPPTQENWRQEEIVHTILSSSLKKTPTVTTHLLDHIWFNSWGFNYYNRLNKIKETDNIDQADFIVQQILDSEKTPTFKNFSEQKRWSLPDGSIAVLYHRDT